MLQKGSKFLNSNFAKKVLQGPFNFVNGTRCKPQNSSHNFDLLMPASGQKFGKIEASTFEDVNNAVLNSKEAFCEWSIIPSRERGKLLMAAAKNIRDNLEDIAQLEVFDNGKPIWEARLDIAACADSIEYYGGIASTIKGDYVPVSTNAFGMIVREPIGVCGAIGAWNYPFQVASWKAAPALASGNTMIFKPSQFTPLTALCLAEAFVSAGIPPGVFNVVQGEKETGEAICMHKDVSKISFTGSIETGEKILKSSANGIKKVTLELGGKSPLIVFKNCDLENAVNAAMLGNFLTQGQVCSNCTRIFVQKDILEEFSNLLLAKVKQMKIGDPFDEETTVGATIHSEHALKVLRYIQCAKNEGATILYGGERVEMPEPYSKGYYLKPCVISNCKDEMTIVQEEVFGAAVCILPFDSEEEVINRANDTHFGLAGGVFSNDIKQAHRVALRIKSGTVWINNYNIYPPELPCGGYKKSGFGRECGEAAINDYTQLKTIFVEMGNVDYPF